MDFTSLLGIIVGCILIVYAILLDGSLIIFYNFPSILITVGGTLAATFAAFPFSTFIKMGSHIRIILKRPKYTPNFYIDTLVELAMEARKNGILSLEDKAMALSDPFLSKSVMLIVDALPPEKTRELLQSEFDSLEARHSKAWKMYEKASSFAPAFGMIGTLIGLVSMLGNLDMDASDGAKQLTSGMAVALLTTLYGSFIANLVFMPIANRLRARHDEEMLCKEIIAEGVLAIQAGDNPRYIEQKLTIFLNNHERNKKRKKEKK